MPLLEVEDLWVSVDGSTILKGVSLKVSRGERLLLLGPNGSGKSTLAMTLLGLGGYRVLRGSITFDGVELNGLTTEERIRLGITASFQFPPQIKGLKLRELAMEVAERHGLDESEVLSWAERLKLKELLDRDFNVGFSGGERKRVEVFLIALQRPKFVVFDEVDSGVDLQSIRLLAEAISDMGLEGSLIITHTGEILEWLDADRACVLVDGKIAFCGSAGDVLDRVRREGFAK